MPIPRPARAKERVRVCSRPPGAVQYGEAVRLLHAGVLVVLLVAKFLRRPRGVQPLRYLLRGAYA